jgi:hypothetical protein
MTEGFLSGKFERADIVCSWPKGPSDLFCNPRMDTPVLDLHEYRIG